jgi:poly(hydroxyalkanoate) depolymerase family esterase
MNEQNKLLDKMRDMTRKLMQDGPHSVTEVIRKALQDAGIAKVAGEQDATPQAPPADRAAGMRDINPPPAGKTVNPSTAPDRASVPPAAGQKSSKATAEATPSTPPRGTAAFVSDLLSKLGIAADGTAIGKKAGAEKAVPTPADAQFLSGSFTNQAGTRQYKLYVPAGADDERLPLVVMLHGCTQDPDDFAAGTQMNAAADAKRCLVLYPQQSQSANSSKCWNWFNAIDQQRGTGEPSILAGMTQQVIDDYDIDRRQVYVAGLSAGGAMAAIMGTTYPDIYAGVAVHSGLPYGAATDLPSALAAMRNGMTRTAQQPAAGGGAFKGIPIIVFHGDADRMVHQKNGEQVVAATAPASHGAPSRHTGQVDGGHAWTRTVRSDAEGKAVAEHWVIHGFGHAWAGGNAAGSYTDSRGPDATAEMMRFFSTHSGTRAA